ncbi:MAG: TonB-dependent receptor, partial [Novosphingobium sp.]
PIPFDAIGQFQAKVAPFDVREGNFQGGSINIVLRSGTNDFQGTGFFAYSSDELTGKKTKPGPGVPTGRVTLPNFTYKNYGAELSGPIIKDRLFFMIAGERVRAALPLPEGPKDNNAGIAIDSISQALVDQVNTIAKSRYGYDTGGILNTNGDKDDRVVAKLDANISDTQRLSLTGTYAKDQLNVGVNNFTSQPQGLSLASNDYIQGNRLYTGVAQLNSEWSDEFSTEVRGFYKNYKRIQDPVLGRGFAQFQVCGAPTSDRTAPGAASSAATACPTTFGSIYFGPDISRQTNALNSETWGGLVQARLTPNDHDLRIFADIQHTKVANSFLQRSSGDYYFDSVADFAAGNAQRFRYGNAVPSLVPEDAASRFNYWSYAFGIQDNWRVNELLTLSYGARYDVFGGNSRPAVSPSFLARYGFPNNAYISGRGVFQPRIGFDFKPVRSLTVRGGIGIFSGGTPDVYVSNSFANTGVLTNSIDVQQANNGTYSGTSGGLPAGAGAAILTNVNGSTIPGAANAYLAQISGNVATNTASTSTVNALDPKFKIPSQWRGTLSFDWQPEFDNFLGSGWSFGADVLYSKVRNQVYFTDLRVRPNGLLTPDGRPRYTPLTSFADTNSDILLTNTKKGRSIIAVARVHKDFPFGLGAGISFVYQDVKDQAPATSSTANSNYTNGAFVDPNNVAYGISNDEVRYNFKYDLSFDHAFFGDYKTTFAMFGETRIGRPFSYTFRDIANRGSVFGTIGSTTGSSGFRYLLYVPTGVSDPNVSFNTAANAQAFDNFVTASGLGKYRGTVAPRNAFNSKWFTRIDLHVSQDIPVPGWSKARVQLFGDVENFTNLLNKNWGQIREYVFPYTIAPVTVSCLTAPVATGTAPTSAQTAANASQPCVQYRYAPNAVDASGNFVAPTDTIYSRQSLYTVRVGVRFTF